MAAGVMDFTHSEFIERRLQETRSFSAGSDGAAILKSLAERSLSLEELMVVQDSFLEAFQSELTKQFAPVFWRNLNLEARTTTVDSTEGVYRQYERFVNLVESFQHLHKQLSTYSESLEQVLHLSKIRKIRDVKKHFQALINAAVFFTLPKSFQELVHSFYSTAFQIHQHTTKLENSSTDLESGSEGDDEGISLLCCGCRFDPEQCHCSKITDLFTQFNQCLHSLNLIEKVAGPAFTETVHHQIKKRINDTCKGDFESLFLPSLAKWLSKDILEWIRTILAHEGSRDVSEELLSWETRLQYFLSKTYASLRIQELFEIIVEYPESRPALEDLKECLQTTDQRAELIKTLRASLESRLLHPGANTSDILTQYVSAIRTLRVLDPAGVILENVCEPVKMYLRTREDTVRCIITSLTDENSSELCEELMHGEPAPIDDLEASDSEDEEEWMPDPVDADPEKSSRSRKTSDIISMLVNIYGSRDMFVSEYRTLLADRILSTFNFDTERELQYLELLKLRFGESHLHFCDIMLQDVADSQRINSHIESSRKERWKSEGREEKDQLDLSAMVLSAVFWPSFREEKLELPPQIQRAVEEFTKDYEALKGMRTLVWKSHLGMVEVDIELEDRTVSVSCTPMQATAIMHFQDKGQWKLDELSSLMQVPSGLLRRRLTFWVSHGVIKEEGHDSYTVVEKQQGANKPVDVVLDIDGESAMASAQDQREEELQVFWSYIVGMLTNLENLPLERIHSMLRMFAMQDPASTQCGLEDVRRFLDRKVRDQELQYVNGVYKLPKGGR